MPLSSQALYFHLNIDADDDGVVEAYPVLKLLGCTEDDLKILVAKNFVCVLNEDLVTYINDWRENNKLRADRKIDSIYKDLLLQVVPDADVLTPKKRADRATDSKDVNGTSQGQPKDGIGKDRLGKDSIGKVSIGEVNEEGTLCEQSSPPSDTPKKTKKRKFTPPTFEEVVAYISEKKLDVNAKKFFDYYESGDWHDGKGNKVKNWKQKCITWDKHNDNPAQESTSSQVFDTPSQMSDEEALDQLRASLKR